MYGQGLPPITVTRDTWYQAVDAARAKAGDDDIPVWACLVHYYSLCVPSVVSPFAKLAWQMWVDLEGFKNETHASYMALPAVLADAFRVINSEVARIEKERAKDKGKNSGRR